MSLSPELLAQLFAQDSGDPFLTLLTLSHPSYAQPLRFVNNTDAIISRGNTFQPFFFDFILPKDDGETIKEISIDFDNVSLELIDIIRSTVGQTNIQLTIEMILASLPNVVQKSITELEILSVTYNRFRVSCKIGLGDFLNVELSSEKYTPKNFRGLF